MKSLSIFFVLVLSVSGSRFIIEPKIYLVKNYEKVAAKVKANPGFLKIEDFSADLDKTLMGKQFKGKVTFNSGFISRIGKFEMNDQKYVPTWNDTVVGFFNAILSNFKEISFKVSMRNGLRMSDFTVTIDLDCNSPEYKTPSVLVINFEFIEFVFEISKNLFTKDIKPTVFYSSIGNFKVNQYPNNAYTEIIAAELKVKLLTAKLVDSLKKWSLEFDKLFGTSVAEIKFPELCYYCP